jgi:hypothetical protein
MYYVCVCVCVCVNQCRRRAETTEKNRFTHKRSHSKSHSEFFLGLNKKSAAHTIAERGVIVVAGPWHIAILYVWVCDCRFKWRGRWFHFPSPKGKMETVAFCETNWFSVTRVTFQWTRVRSASHSQMHNAFKCLKLETTYYVHYTSYSGD